MMNRNRILSALLALVLAFSMGFTALMPATAQASDWQDVLQGLLDSFGDNWEDEWGDWGEETDEEEEQTSPIIEPQAIADYLFKHGKLPENFITKNEARDLGWDSSYNYVSDVAPGYSIGGDKFGNYEGILPKKKGRQYYECDCFYVEGKRSAHRVVYSNDGLVFYTGDHYETFTQLFPSWEKDNK